MLDPGTPWRVFSVVGFLLLVVPYLLAVWRRCAPDGWRFLLSNALGSGMLAVYSGVIGEIVFLLLEGMWCVGSLVKLTETLRSRSP